MIQDNQYCHSISKSLFKDIFTMILAMSMSLSMSAQTQYESIADSIIALVENETDDEAKMKAIFDNTFYYDFAPFTLPLLHQAAELADQQDDKKYKVESIYSFGQYYNFSSKYDTAQIYIDQALALPYIDDHIALKTELLEAKAVALSRSDDIQGAINYFTQSLEILELPHSRARYIETEGEEDLQKMSSIIHNNIGNLYKRIEAYDEAIIHYDQAVELMYALDAERYAATVIMNKANAYLDQKLFDKALAIHQTAKSLKVKYDASPRTVAFSNLNIGICLNGLEQYTQADIMIDSALVVFEEINNNKGLSYSYAEKGLGYASQGLYNKAIQYCQKSKDILDEVSIVDYAPKVYDCLYRSYKGVGNANMALSAYEELTALQDSALNAANYRKVGQLESKLIYEKEQEIAAITLQNQQRVNRNNKIGFGILFLGLALITGLIYKNYKDKKSSAKILGEKNAVITKSLNEKDLLLREIHHRVKNNLQIISSLLRLQSAHVDDPAALGALRKGQDRVRSMALIHQNLYQEENLTSVKVKEYFTKLIDGLFSSNMVHDDRIKLEMNVSDLWLDVDTIIPIGLITNELITNSLKYAFPNEGKGNIKVYLGEEENQLHLRIEDDGVGMSDEAHNQLGSSFGYKMIGAFVDRLDGEMTITRNHGTSVAISFKEYKKA